MYRPKYAYLILLTSYYMKVSNAFQIPIRWSLGPTLSNSSSSASENCTLLLKLVENLLCIIKKA